MDYYCVDCLCVNPDIFMLRSVVWREVVGVCVSPPLGEGDMEKVRIVLCFSCCERRLGRRIVGGDLKPNVVCNFRFFS